MKTSRMFTATDSRPPWELAAKEESGRPGAAMRDDDGRAEEAERARATQQQALLDTLLQLGADIVAMLDARGRITFLNRSFDGASGASYVGRHAAAFITPAHREHVRQAMVLAEATGAPHAFECRAYGPQGPWLLVRIMPPSGAMRGFIAVITDITAQRLAEDTRRRLAALMEFSTDAIIGISGGGLVTGWSRGAEVLFGRAAEEARGRFALDWVPAAERERELGILQRAWSGQATPAAEGRRLRSDGEIVDVVTATFPHRSESGRVIGVTQMVRNMSALRALETQLEQAQRLVSQGRLAAAAAHEIANCLAVIHGNASVLDELVTEPDAARRIAALLHASALGGRLCGQLRDLSRPQAANPERIDLAATVRQACVMLERIVRQRLVLKVETDDPLTVLADASHLDQILVNLVLNARDATPIDGTITIRVGFADRRGPGGDWRRLEVIDNGSGIPSGVQGLLFKTIFTTKSAGHGTGLGLATVHRLVRGMSGDVRLSSEPGQGTRVTVSLPPAEEG